MSYPTIRLRLDRLIAKIEVYESEKPMTEFERTARALAADGKLEPAALKALLSAYHEERETPDENPDKTVDNKNRARRAAARQSQFREE